ncbi:hypothetical protein ACFVSN_28310 [Kitasatospora sp. NPDC057904]|uniref:hypothetical protein n=1 Tax=Kitasatospora sp. NPDC057904 TaxID=3346275 RepID=UPI0036D9DE41
MTTPPRTRKLTPREAEALAQLVAGHPLPRGTRAALRRAMEKLGAATEAEAVALAKRLGADPAEAPSAVRRKPPAEAQAETAAPARAAAPAKTAAPAKRAAPAKTAAPPGERPRSAARAEEQPRREPGKVPGRPTEGTGGGLAAGTARPAPAPAEQRRIPAKRREAGAEQRPGARPADPGPRTGARDDAGPGTFEELYEASHTRLVQQVFLLTACRHRAAHCVRRAFGEARRAWDAVAGSGNPEAWVRVRASELALSPWHRGGPRRAHAWRLPHRRIKVRPADESQAVLPDHDRLTDRDRALLKALKRLSRPQRRALVLHDGLGLPAAAVAVEVESTLAAAEGRVWAARAALAQWVPDLAGPDPADPGFADRLSGLLHRAAVRGCPEPHRPAVPVLRARHGLRSLVLTGAAAALTASVGGAAMMTLVGGRPAVLFREPEPPAPSVCVQAPDAAEPGVPVAPGGPAGGISSLWCSPTPGLEAVVVDPPPRAIALWELPAAAKGAEAPPPQGPPKCARWAPLPCTPAR